MRAPIAVCTSLAKLSARQVAGALRELRKVGQPLFIAPSSQSLVSGAEPGVFTLLGAAPQHEELARSLAWGVVTCQPKEAKRLEKLGRPVFLLKDKNLEGLSEWINGLRSLPKPNGASGGPEENPITFCSVADANFFPHWFGLFKNLQAVHSGAVKAHLLCLDNETKRLAKEHISSKVVRTYQLDEIYSENELRKVRLRSIPLQAFTSKPAILAHILKRTHTPIFLLDADMFFFKSPASLLKEIESHALMLFPQWNDDLRFARLHGIFNTGMVLANPDALPFVEWWRELCLWECRHDPERGYFIDQGYMDLAPVYFENALIYRKPDHNVGNWNVSSSGLKMKKNTPTVRGGLPLSSFHAAIQDEFGLFDLKATWDQTQAWAHNLSSASLHRQTLKQQSRHWPELRLLELAHHTLTKRLHLPLPEPSDVVSKWWTDSRLSGAREALLGSYRTLRKMKRLVFSVEGQT